MFFVIASHFDDGEAAAYQQRPYVSKCEIVNMSTIIASFILRSPRETAIEQKTPYEIDKPDIGRSKNQDAVPFQYPADFLNEFLGVKNMLNDIQAWDTVEDIISER